MSSSRRRAGRSGPRAVYKCRADSSGVGLIEVLIAILVMGIGLLGIAAMQATALRNSQSSLERSQAVIHSYGILDAMRANLPVARAGGYNTPGFVCVPPATDTTLVAADHARWIKAIEDSMGEDACGRIQCLPIVNSESRSCTVTVRWNDARATEGSDEQQIQTVSRL
ncbi:type IV pilus modification protein PilV [Novilysobacter antarcticus]|uniref:type IV pilus modification protein PilV n=1 Tax=Novilysobacter antarcticus TaxID=2862543 RepID=UPI003CCD28D3